MFEKRNYQIDIINEVLSLEVNTLIQLPTGGGKTYIATEIIKKLTDLFGEHKQVLFIAPKIILMEQTLKAFEKEKLRPEKVHGQSKFNIDNRVLVSTIHTASRRNKLKPDVIIIDEIHYGFNGEMLKILIDNNPNARLVGLSATPYDQYGKKLKGFKYIDNIDVSFLMKNNFLVEKLRQFELVKQDLSKIKIIAGDYDKKQLGEVVCNTNTILEIIETTKEVILNSKKTIVFAVDINHAEILTEAYINAGFKAKALHSKSHKDEFGEAIEINEEIEAFRRGQTKVLVSVLMLTTGFDVPDTDCAVIARPTKSQNLYKQMVGRILRKSDNKHEAILLDCGNVIKNLGMPLDPIKEMLNSENNQQLHCKNCESENIKLVKNNKELYWECLDCGFRKKVDSGSYKCESCKEVYGYDAEFIRENNKLKLICKCGHGTTISEYTTEELIEIIKSDKVTNPDIYQENISEIIDEKKEDIFKLKKEALNPKVFNKKAKDRLYEIAKERNKILIIKRLAKLKYKLAKNFIKNLKSDNLITNSVQDIKKAIKKADIQKIKYLIKNNIDLNAKDDDGFTILELALKKDKENIIELLIHNGADIHHKNKLGLNALILSATHGKINVLKLLLENGADVNTLCSDGSSLLYLITVGGKIEVLKLLIDYDADVNQKDLEGNSPLSSAVRSKNIKKINLLIENSADINSQNNEGHSILATATILNLENIEILNILIKNGADVNMKNKSGYSPLMYTLINKNIEQANLLLENGADVNIKIDNTLSPLIYAVQDNNKDIINLLIKYNADINIQDDKGDTALIIASKQGYHDIVQILIDNGADTSIKNNKGEISLSL